MNARRFRHTDYAPPAQTRTQTSTPSRLLRTRAGHRYDVNQRFWQGLGLVIAFYVALAVIWWLW